MTHLQIDIPMPPFPYTRVRFGHGRPYNKTKYTENKESLMLFMLQKARKFGWKPTEYPAELYIIFYLNPARKPEKGLEKHPAKYPDIDNYAKAVMDSGNGVLWKDDCQIVRLIAEKKYTKSEPKIMISLKPVL